MVKPLQNKCEYKIDESEFEPTIYVELSDYMIHFALLKHSNLWENSFRVPSFLVFG